MQLNSKFYRTIIAALALILLLPACNKSRKHPGYIYFPDMHTSQAFETYSDNPVFADGKTMREPVPGTIPRGFEIFPYELSDEEMMRAGKELVNPFSPKAENIERGRLSYQWFCLHCHGELGDGKGPLFTGGKYPYPPASLISDKMVIKPDGEYFHQITLGWGIMGPHNTIVRPDDRWKIINYIREELQRKNY